MVRILDVITPTFLDYPDNCSMSLCVCFMGCVNECEGCQNPEFKDPQLNKEYTREVSVEELVQDLKVLCIRNDTDKVVLSGGDPLSPYNIEFVKQLLKYENIFDFCIYTGHSVEYVKEKNVTGFKFLKCGKFDMTNKRESCKTNDEIRFSSPNQELYDSKFELLSIDGIYKF